MRTSTKVFAIAGVLALAGLLVWGFAPRAAIVETGEVLRGPFERVLVEDGRTRVRERYVVAAPLAGRIERVALEPGDRVRRGQPLARLQPALPALVDARTERELRERVGGAEDLVERARADSARAAAQYEQARADAARQVKLAQSGFLSGAAREQAELALAVAARGAEAARFSEAASRHELEQAKAALSRYRGGEAGGHWTIVSPVEGSVLKVAQKSEGPVAMGAAILEIGDSSKLEAVVDFLSQEAVALSPGLPARISVGRGGASADARVRTIEPSAFTKVSALGIEEQRVNVVLDFVGPLEGVATLGDGYRIEARVVLGRLEDVVKVPAGALTRASGGEWAVFVVDAGRAQRRRIRLGPRSGTEAVVEEGLAAGARVVMYPSETLKDGARVEERSGGSR